MAIRFRGVLSAKRFLGRSVLASKEASSVSVGVPRGYCPIYVGEEQKKRFMVPISYLNQPLFQDLLSKAEEEFGFDHPTGGLTIPCSEDIFFDLTSRLNCHQLKN